METKTDRQTDRQTRTQTGTQGDGSNEELVGPPLTAGCAGHGSCDRARSGPCAQAHAAACR